MMKKKILVLALAAAMTFETVAPAIAFADELPAEDTAIVCEEPAAAAEEADLIIEETASADEEPAPAGEETAAENEESAPAAEEETPENEEPAPAAEEEAPVNEEAAPASEKSAEEKAKEMLDEKASEEKSKSLEDEFSSNGEGGTGNSGSAKSEFNASKLVLKESKMISQQTINGLIDQMCKTNPTIMFLGAPLKGIISELFGLGSADPNAAIIEQIKELNHKIDDAEKAVKEHVTNVVALDSVGDVFTKLNDSIDPLDQKINDIKNWYNKGHIDEAEKIKELGALYHSDEYSTVNKGLSAALNAYRGENSNFLDGKSIFGAAFKMQAVENMFSSEVITAITPYLMRQLAIYLNACTLINEVLDNYELSRGIGAAEYTRGKMEENLEEVLNRYNGFFGTDKYIFLNHGKSYIRLSRDMVVAQCAELYSSNYKTKNARVWSIMANSPLSDEQIQNISIYASKKGVTVFDFLFNEMGFRPVKYTAEEIMAFAKKGEVVVPYAYQTENWPSKSGSYVKGENDPYLATGIKQFWEDNTPGVFSTSIAISNEHHMMKLGSGCMKSEWDLLIFQAA